MSEWYFKELGRDLGPVVFGELRNLAASGRVVADTRVRHVKATDWIRAGDIAGLIPVAAASPPPIPMARPVAVTAMPNVVAKTAIALRSASTWNDGLGAVSTIFGAMALLAYALVYASPILIAVALCLLAQGSAMRYRSNVLLAHADALDNDAVSNELLLQILNASRSGR
jgi:hypothetical protein